MKTAPVLRREPKFRGGGPISPVGFVAVPLCLGGSGRVLEGEISRSLKSGRTKLVGVAPPPRCVLLLLIATAVPKFTFRSLYPVDRRPWLEVNA